ncbi:MAG: single-stranded DNA-binding protein [Ornithinimicrobium sp.]
MTDVNEIHLVGRVTGAPVEREMPSGDRVVTLRITLDRPARPTASPPARRRVDAVDLACWSAPTREVTERLDLGARLEVHGALRRRFYRAGSVTLSRYEVEVEQLTPVLP